MWGRTGLLARFGNGVEHRLETIAGMLADIDPGVVTRDPFRQFEKWFQEAEAAKIAEPNSMVLATASRDGRPSIRIVLLKGLDFLEIPIMA